MLISIVIRPMTWLASCVMQYSTRVHFVFFFFRFDYQRGIKGHPNHHHWRRPTNSGSARQSAWSVLCIPPKTKESITFHSSNAAEHLPGHVRWTELPWVLGPAQAHPPLFIQGRGKSYGSPCIQCTRWTRVQPRWGDNATPSLTTEWQSAHRFNFLQMQPSLTVC